LDKDQEESTILEFSRLDNVSNASSEDEEISKGIIIQNSKMYI